MHHDGSILFFEVQEGPDAKTLQQLATMFDGILATRGSKWEEKQWEQRSPFGCDPRNLESVWYRKFKEAGCPSSKEAGVFNPEKRSYAFNFSGVIEQA